MAFHRHKKIPAICKAGIFNFIESFMSEL